MNILYGVCGEGMGHAMRSAVVAEHLQNKGHHLRFVSSGGAADYLEKRWPDRVRRVVGLTSSMTANALHPFRTLLSNALKQIAAIPTSHVLTLLSIGKEPDVVISDFEPWSARYAKIIGTPLVAVDNIHFMNRCTHPRSVVVPDRTAAASMYPIVQGMVPDAKRYLVTTFVLSPVEKPWTTIHAPILRRSILASQPSAGDHVCVYFNSLSDHTRIAGELQKARSPFHYFGSPFEGQSGNITFFPFTESTFVTSAASSRAIVGGAGFTLMSEAIYFRKPMLASPFEGQFEQILNANYLELVGFGERARPSVTAAGVEKFLLSVPTYADKLASYRHDGNRELFAAVESAIASK